MLMMHLYKKRHGRFIILGWLRVLYSLIGFDVCLDDTVLFKKCREAFYREDDKTGHNIIKSEYCEKKERKKERKKKEKKKNACVCVSFNFYLF